ncbi:hypothetical protein ACFU6I_20500 [Streptomyces sp. NPDC057486]|uniref:hypothetical protein n=1 Tax=Streptomyces sp. NPDC057486 TaxID=3346145 RepID=UPI0036D12E78
MPSRCCAPRPPVAAVLTILVGPAGVPAAASAEQAAPAAAATALVPRPVAVDDAAGDEPFVLRPSLAVVAQGEADRVGEQLAVELRKATGFRLPVRGHGGGNAIRIPVDPAAKSTVAGTDALAPRGVTARLGLGLVAAPGTKASDDGTRIIPDTMVTDGDRASSSALTEHLTATAKRGDRVPPVTFTRSRARDSLHGAGLCTAGVKAAFTRNTNCLLTPSVGDPVSVRVQPSDTPSGADHASAAPALSVPRDVKAGTWFPQKLTGFEPGYVDIRIDDVGGRPA